MNIPNIYNRATQTTSIEELKEEEARRQQISTETSVENLNRNLWLKNPQTHKFLEELSKKIKEIDTQAKNLAFLVDGASVINNKLVESRTIENIIIYANTGKYGN